MSKIVGRCNFKLFSDMNFWASGILCVDDILEFIQSSPDEVVTGKNGKRYVKFSSLKIKEPLDHNTHCISIGKYNDTNHLDKGNSKYKNRMVEDKPIKVVSDFKDDLPF